MKRFFSNKNFTVGFILSSVVVVVALISLTWTPYDSNRMNARSRLQAPSLIHPLGTDHYGRDTLTVIVRRSALAPHAVAAQHVAMVGCEHDERVLATPHPVQLLEDDPDLRQKAIDIADVAAEAQVSRPWTTSRSSE